MTKVMTPFDPAVHGFEFRNDFDDTTWVGAIDIHIAGRCGGMTSAALDYFVMGLPIPPSSWHAGPPPYVGGVPAPTPGHPLAQYIFQRQEDVKFTVGAHIVGRMLPSATNWYGRGIRGGADYRDFKETVDEGRPANVALISMSPLDLAGSHFVCAIGYAEGSFGDEDINLYIYDPNHPKLSLFLRPNGRRGCFEELFRAGPAHLDAALLHPNGHIYFFSRDDFAKYVPHTGALQSKADLGTGEWSLLPAGFRSKIDAAASHPDGHLHLFSGTEFVRYPPFGGIRPGVGTIGQDGWRNLPQHFRSDLDAAVGHPNGHIYFFKGSSYVKYQPSAGVVGGQRRIGIDGWKSLPKSFRSDLDAAVEHPNGHIYFFKGNNYVKFRPYRGVVGGIRTIGTHGWRRLPTGFSGITHVADWKNYFVDKNTVPETPPMPPDANAPTIDWTGSNHSGHDHSDEDLTRHVMIRATFNQANLTTANLSGADASHANFIQTDMTESTLRGLKAEHANFVLATLTGATLDGADCDDAHFDKASLGGLKFRDGWARRADFDRAALQDALFNGTNFDQAVFKGATGNATHFDGARLARTNFRGANLDHCRLTGADLSHADFRGAVVTNTDLTGAELDFVRWGDAKLNNCNWVGTTSIFRNDLSAAAEYGGDRLYLFKGDRYVRYDPEVKICSEVRTVGDNGWTALPTGFHSGLDATLLHPDHHVYFFKGSQCVKYPQIAGESGVALTIGEELWPKMPHTFRSDLDAAICHPSGYIYFFKGGRYVKYLPNHGPVGKEIRVIGVDGWKTFPSLFHRDLDAAVLHTNGHIYFFKGTRYIKYRPFEGVIGGVRTIGVTGWHRVP
ncbi:MAG: hypothetical protein GY788_07935 [bacterium]|nr:hypothetical protein [bacterium]